MKINYKITRLVYSELIVAVDTDEYYESDLINDAMKIPNSEWTFSDDTPDTSYIVTKTIKKHNYEL